MIILKHNKTVYFAYSGVDSEPMEKDNRLVWRTGKNKSVLVGVFGSPRLADVLRYESIVTEELNKNNIVLNTLPILKSLAQRFDLYKNSALTSDVFVAKKDKAYKIDSNGAVYEIEEVYSHHLDIVKGIYDSGPIKNPESFLVEAAKRIEFEFCGAQFPLVIANTKKREVKIINREDV